MNVVKGNKTVSFSREELVRNIQKYERAHLDIGTGDGRFVFKSAQRNDRVFYVGLDPVEKQLSEYSKKANKSKLENALFVVGSVELLPEELIGFFSSVSIIMPWGTLLQSVVRAEESFIRKLKDLLVGSGTIDIIFGYAENLEPSEVARLGLDKLSTSFISTNIVPNFMRHGFKAEIVEELNRKDLASLESTWSKRLAFGNDRPLFHIRFRQQVAKSSSDAS